MFWRGGYLTTIVLIGAMQQLPMEDLMIAQLKAENDRLRRELDERTRERDDALIESHTLGEELKDAANVETILRHEIRGAHQDAIELERQLADVRSHVRRTLLRCAEPVAKGEAEHETTICLSKLPCRIHPEHRCEANRRALAAVMDARRSA